MKLNREIVALPSGTAILGFVEARRAEFAEAHLVTALHRLAKSRDGNQLNGHAVLKNVVTSLHLRVLDTSTMMSPRHLANSIWALARLAVHDVPLTKELHGDVCELPRRVFFPSRERS